MQNNSKNKTKKTFFSVFMKKTEGAFDMFVVAFVVLLL